MSNLSAAFSVLMNNSSDVKTIVDQLGGVTGTLRVMPALLRIVETVAADRGGDEHAEPAERVLYYNVHTKERIAAFQKKHGLAADGIVGNKTWDKVEELLSA